MDVVVALGLAVGLISFFQCMCLNCACLSLNRLYDRLEKLENTCPVCNYKKFYDLHHRLQINPIHIHVDEDPEPYPISSHV
jgi:hypothetical protein